MWYDVGTVSVTNGSTTVTGAGTDFISGVQVGEGLYIGGDLYEIGVVNSSTQLTLSDAYLGSTATGQAYKIIPTQSLVADLSSGVADLISDFADVRDYAGNGKFNDGTQASPAITFTQDQNNGLYRIGSDNWGMSAGGQKQVDISTTDVELNYSGSKKLATTATGVGVTGNIESDSVTIGVGSVATTEKLRVNGTVLTLGGSVSTPAIGIGDVNTGIYAPTSGTLGWAVNGTQRLLLNSTGVDVTGTITADGLKIANSTYITQNDGISSNPRMLGMNSAGTTYIGPIDSYRGGSIFYGASPNVTNQFFYTGGIQTMRLAQGGDVSFYEDTGTTAKMVWDASAESLGIGTTAPFTTLALPFGAGIGIGDASINTIVSRSSVFPRVTTIADSYNNASSRIDFTMRAGATEENTPLSILASGNVGIGTASPDYTLDVAGRVGFGLPNTTLPVLGGNTANFRIGNLSASTINYGTMFGTLGTGDGYIQQQRFDGSATAYDLLLQPNGGNVGIGTASPTNKLSVSGNAGLANGITSFNGSAFTRIYGDATHGGNVNWNTGGALRFAISNDDFSGYTEKARIDSSGNLLVGTTSTSVGYDSADAGIALRGKSGSLFSRDNSFAISANRNGIDGDIVEFRKDGATVGSIGVDNSDNLYITGNSSHAGLMCGSTEILPYKGTTLNDGVNDIGASSFRWKDLYLSGGVYLGGTGAANKLDDYEEGTWIPTVYRSGGASTLTYSSQIGKYTRVGNTVYIEFEIGVNSVTSQASGYTLIGGLPFSSAQAAGYTNIMQTQGSAFSSSDAITRVYASSASLYVGIDENSGFPPKQVAIQVGTQRGCGVYYLPS